MARTLTYKLILSGKASRRNLFFDLQRDPQELHNLWGVPEVQSGIQRLTAAIATWQPKEMSRRYVDLQAPQIHGSNVPSGLGHRQKVIDYYRAKMLETKGH